jgi:hypothetical protein
MKSITNRIATLVIALIFTGYAATAQNTKTTTTASSPNTTTMKSFLIEREIPGAGNFTAEELKGLSQKSCGVLTAMGPKIQWVHSYVTGNKIYCIYKAENAELVKEHAQKGGFPANVIVEIGTVISPETAK